MFFKNEVFIEGFLTDSPVMKENKNQKKYCYFTVCYNDAKKEGEEWINIPNFFYCTAWGKEAENIAGYNKGQAVSVIGKLVQHEWTDDNGGKHNQTSITAFHVRKLDFQRKTNTEIENPEIMEIPDMDEPEIPEQIF